MELFKHTLYINLDERGDRRFHVENELQKMSINGVRFPAKKTNDGAVGCTLSHIECLQIAKQNNYPQVFICEDDIQFLKPELLKQNINKFNKNKELSNWDILMIGGNVCQPYNTTYDYCVKIVNAQTTTGYIVKSHYYDTLINNYKDGLRLLIKHPNNRREFALDIYWKQLQPVGNWYIIIPLTVTQYPNYSNIENRKTNYSHLMLDLEKNWLFKNNNK